MILEVKIPNVAESITEVTIARWFKKSGDFVNQDEAICELETDKATQELVAEASGVLEILVKEGETVNVGASIAKINSDGQGKVEQNTVEIETTPKENASPTLQSTGQILEMKVEPFAESITEVVIGSWIKNDGDFVKMDEPICEVETDKATQELTAQANGILRIVAQAGATLQIGDLICKIEVSSTANVSTQDKKSEAEIIQNKEKESSYAKGHSSPSATKILAEKGIETKDVVGTGKDGRITKEDALKAEVSAKTEIEKTTVSQKEETLNKTEDLPAGNRSQRRVRMTQLRKTISRRLVAVKNETAMLTTFNEANMKPIMDLRAKFKDQFKEKYGVGLGFMSFFCKACAEALLQVPEVNAMIDSGEIVYNDYVDISVAVSAPRGLVVPVLRNVETMGFSQIELGIAELANKARNNTLTIEEMTGGTFTITNGGIFGSMMSTPIINAPQSAILGMHNIVERAVVINGEIVVRPMMYLALSYDHRIIDGREAVTFLVKVKQYLEEPERLMLGV